MGAYVEVTQLGYLCTLCLHHWPLDPLDREPDFSFHEYMEWCATADLKFLWAELDFIRWLYSPMNSAYSSSNTTKGAWNE